MLDTIPQQSPYGEAIKRTLRRIAARLFPRAYFKWSQTAQRSQASWFIGEPAYVLTFEIDSPLEVEALSNALDVLARYRIPAGFCCSGELIERHHQLFKRAVDEGHEMINRAFAVRDQDPALNGKTLRLEEIESCHRACELATGYRMIGFRMPEPRRPSAEIYAALRKLGYLYSSSLSAIDTRAWGLPYPESGGILEIPLSPSALSPNAPFSNWRSPQRRKGLPARTRSFEKDFSETLEAVAVRGSFATHSFRLSELMESGKLEFACAILAGKRARNGLRLTTYRDFLERSWKECFLF